MRRGRAGDAHGTHHSAGREGYYVGGSSVNDFFMRLVWPRHERGVVDDGDQ